MNAPVKKGRGVKFRPFSLTVIPTETLTDLAEAAARNPDDAQAAIRYAEELQKQGQALRAVVENRRALGLEHTLVEGWVELGRLELNSGAAAEAIHCLRRALALASNRADTHFNLGKAYFALGEIGAALEHLRIIANSSDPE